MPSSVVSAAKWDDLSCSCMVAYDVCLSPQRTLVHREAESVVRQMMLQGSLSTDSYDPLGLDSDKMIKLTLLSGKVGQDVMTASVWV